jgi:hypothetical protein
MLERVARGLDPPGSPILLSEGQIRLWPTQPPRNMPMRTVMYKNREYHLAWLGDTKYGRRAKLQFKDGSKEFWVPAEAVETVGAITYARLRDGSWGLRADGSAVQTLKDYRRTGRGVAVTTRKGEVKYERPGKILWEGHDEHGQPVVLCAISGQAATDVCPECGRPADLVQDMEDGALKCYDCCDLPPQGF